MLVIAPLAVAALATLPQEEVAPDLHGADAARRVASQAASSAALDWLASFQDQDGRWDCDGFAKHAPQGAPVEDDKEAKSDVFWDDDWLEHDLKRKHKAKPVAAWGAGPGDASHDIGVTGLALLAFLADGHTMTQGRYKDTVKRGIKWLIEQQDRDSGLFGEAVGHAFMYDHSIATLAVCETLYLDRSTLLKSRAQNAINFIAIARNPYGVWRYEVPPNGDNDTSVTTWTVLALDAAMRADLKVDREAITATIQWLDQMTDPSTGRVGYNQTGSVSSRIPGVNVHFGMESTETLTAAGLMCRLTLGQKPAESQALIDNVRLIVRTIPDEVPKTIDDALWVFFGTRSTSRLGGRPWEMWSKTYMPAVIGSQSKEGPGAGSWDPKNAWGFSMGRVGTTALLAWTLASVD